MLSETWSDNDERVSITNFDTCVQFKQPGRRAAGVAIYSKLKNSQQINLEVYSCDVQEVLDFCNQKLKIDIVMHEQDIEELESVDEFNQRMEQRLFSLAIHQNDHQARRKFVEWAQNEIAVVPDFHKRILFSYEAHFWLNGYVNKQNCRIWSEANPQVYVETPLYPEKLTVWCAIWAGGIIGPYFFNNDEGHNVTVNGDRLRAMITNFFIPELNNHDVQELWFQQDGATCHTAWATIDLL
ncbi:uncharacterized protein TNCV_963321 [Trichonephila clavipes]|nr:uncharacterized protein TNCV_963321 [Trichonephila clavipes]